MSILGSIVQASSGGAGGTSFTDVSTAIDYTVTGTTSERIYVDTTSAVVSITLPSGSTNQVIEVIDAGDNAGTNIITIVGTIDGVSNATIEADSGSRALSYSGSAWETSGGFQNYFKRNASTGEISTREPDTFVADELQASSGTATVFDQSVADADYTSIGVNVDQTVADEFGNDTLNSDAVTGNAPWTESTDMWSVDAGDWESVLNGTLALAPTQGSAIDIFVMDLQSAQRITAVGFTLDGAGGSSFQYKFAGSNDWNGATGTFTDIGPSFNIGNGVQSAAVTDETLYRYVKMVNVFTNGARTLEDITVFSNSGFVSTLNTFDTNLATASSGTFSPSSFKAYTEAAALISGTGKVNVAYEIDGGGMGSLVDQDTFKALSDVSYTTQFDLQLQLVGAQRFSKATLSSAVVKSYVGQAGVVVEQGGLVYTELGDVFKAPKKTTTERNALTPAAGWVIYNSTTNKMNFYNGSAWEAITSA